MFDLVSKTDMILDYRVDKATLPHTLPVLLRGGIKLFLGILNIIMFYFGGCSAQSNLLTTRACLICSQVPCGVCSNYGNLCRIWYSSEHHISIIQFINGVGGHCRLLGYGA